MITTNPFAELSTTLSPATMKAYVILMVVLVIAGTLFDIIHKKSARYFFENFRKSRERSAQPAGSGGLVGIAVRTAAVDVLASGEFCNARRRVAHLLTMYGFILYAATTAIMVFAYPRPWPPTPALHPLLWHLGALMVCGGGYWFWFFIRVDVAAEGHSPWRVVRADLFVLSLLASTTFALLWSFFQAVGAGAIGGFFFVLYLIATTALFAGVPWSKFAHMFFKPAAAFEKRVAEADGTRSNLPPPADKPKVFGSARRMPQHY